MTDIIYNTNLTLNAYLAPGAAPNNSIEGMAIQLASGIMGLFMKPMFAGPLAFAQLPNQFALLGGTMQQPQMPGEAPVFLPTPGAQWNARLSGQGQGSIDLGDGYTLQLDERNSEITIRNSETGEVTRIWGDPHVDVDGRRAFDFWGTTTFTLENGTKITIDTEQWGGNPNAYVASQLTITRGNQAIVVDGISQNRLGDLSISMSNNGYALDAFTRDGFVLHENATGSGWRSELTGQVATQADLNLTRPGEIYGPGSNMPSLGELNSVLSAFLFFGMVASLADAFGGGNARILPAPVDF
jgi:hypothetical protein